MPVPHAPDHLTTLTEVARGQPHGDRQLVHVPRHQPLRVGG